MPIDLAGFNHIALRTGRLEESMRFYTEVLGFREISRPPFDFRGHWLFAGGVQIHLIEATGEAPLDRGSEARSRAIDTRENHMAFACPDLDAAENALRSHGIVYKRNIVPERMTNQIFFRDPDGWSIELGYYTAPIDR